MSNYLREHLMEQIAIPHLVLFYHVADRKVFRISRIPVPSGMDAWAFHDIDFSGCAGSGNYLYDPADVIAYAERRIDQFQSGRLYGMLLSRADPDDAFGWRTELHLDPSVTHGRPVEKLIDRFDA